MIPGVGHIRVRAGCWNVAGNVLKRRAATDILKVQRARTDAPLKSARANCLGIVGAYDFLVGGGYGVWLDQSLQGEGCLAAIADIQVRHGHAVSARTACAKLTVISAAGVKVVA